MPEVFSEEQKEVFRSSPEKYLAFRKAVEIEINAKFRMLVNGAEAAERARTEATSSMLGLLGPKAEEMAEQLIPDFPVGCRRITPGVGYLESFSEPNVRVITNAIINNIDENGIQMASGEHLAVDAIICATGFDVSFSPRFPITGRDGAQLKDIWTAPRIPQAYLSMAIPKFPNYFSKYLITVVCIDIDLPYSVSRTQRSYLTWECFHDHGAMLEVYYAAGDQSAG